MPPRSSRQSRTGGIRECFQEPNTNVTRRRDFFKWQRESQAELDVDSEGQSVHDAFMPEKSISERVDDCEKIQGDLQTDLEKHSGRLRELEADVKDLVKLFEH